MGRLPAAATAFVGRRRELAAARRLFSATRLLTLTGTAGIGKTRLAMELARRAGPGEVWFVELASLRDARAPARAVAAATGLAGRREPRELAEALGGRAGLVVLDNCEHLVEASAELAAALISGCPELRILTTSREPLGVRGEVVWQVPGLHLADLTRRPPPGRLRACDAVAFFAQSAARRMPGFAIDDRQLAVVAGICRRLDANPLALELAAARIAHLTLEEIERRLDGSFGILTSSGRGSAERHRSLWTAIDWSHDLLTDPDRVLFRRLSVFRGGFGLDAAAAVAGSPDVLAGVARLVEKSLVLSLATSGTPRYRLLETLREYGRRALRESGEEAAVRARHAAWFVGAAERADPLLHGPDAVAALDDLELEHDNLRAALDWGVEHDPASAAGLASVLGDFWTQRGYLSEGRERLERCLAVLEGADQRRFALLLAGANLALRQSDYPGCRRYLEPLLAGACGAGDRSAEAHARDLLGRVALEEGYPERAAGELAKAMRLFRALEDRGGEARVHWHLNMVVSRQGDLEASRDHVERFRAIAAAIRNPRAIGHAHLALAFRALAERDREALAIELRAALGLLGSVADRWSLANALRLSAVLAVQRGAGHHGLVLLAAAAGMDEAIGARPGPMVTRLAAHWTELALRGTPPAGARAAEAWGRRMALGEAVGFALGVVGVGTVSVGGRRACRVSDPARLADNLDMTYSIVARDPETGDLGVAVQSHYFSVGPVVPWGLAGVGAVATQSLVNISFGPIGVEMMRLGYGAREALDAVLAADPDRESRQCAMVDARGRVAAHTGSRCVAAAGHRTGDGYSVQANLMERDTVWDAMAAAYESAGGPVAERMLAALEAAEAEGGDIRGRQSAAMVVFSGSPTGRSWEDRTIDLRVDDHPGPVAELGRLLRYRRAYQAAAVPGDVAGHRRALELAPEVTQLRFFAGVALARAGEWEEALLLLREAIGIEPRWEETLRRLAPSGRVDAGLVAEIESRLRAQAP